MVAEDKAKISRRKYLKYVAAGAGVVVVAAAGAYEFSRPAPPTAATTGMATAATTGMATAATTGPPAKKYEGLDFIGIGQEMPTNDGFRAVAGDWAKDTGANVLLKGMSWEENYEKGMLGLTSHSREFDFLVVDEIWVQDMAPYLIPIDDFIDRGIANPNLLAIDDFVPIEWQTCSVSEKDGKHYFMPYMTDTRLFIYRKDLFEDTTEKANFEKQFGYPLAPPKTPEQLIDMASFFTRDTTGDGQVDFYGFADTWQRGYHDFAFGDWLYAYGGEYFDEKWTPTLNSTAGVKAMEMMLKMKPYTPPDVFAFGFDEITAAFLAGRCAMVLQWFSPTPLFLDPAKNPYAKGTGYAPTPLKGSTGMMGLGINADTKHPEGIYEMIEYAVAPQFQEKYWEFGATPVRVSAYENTEIYGKIGTKAQEEELFAAVLENIKVPERGWVRPRIKGYGAFTDTLSTSIAPIMSGELSVKEGLDKAASNIYEVMKKAGYYG
jgi:multiple sugar transport system substrate-binding protein